MLWLVLCHCTQAHAWRLCLESVLGVHTAARAAARAPRERELVNEQGEVGTCYQVMERERERVCVKLGLYYLQFGKDQELFQTNQ